MSAEMYWFLIGFASAFALLILVRLLFVGQIITLYIQGYLSMCSVPFLALVGMRLRRQDCRTIMVTHIRLNKAGIRSVPVSSLEVQALSGGNVTAVATAVIMAERAGIEFSWDDACSWDLSGTRDVIQTVVDAEKRGERSIPALDEMLRERARSGA